MKNIVNRAFEAKKTTIHNFTKRFASIMNSTTSGQAYIEHIFSIYSAYIGTRWKPAGRMLRVTAMLCMMMTVGVGQMWGTDYTYRLVISKSNLVAGKRYILLVNDRTTAYNCSTSSGHLSTGITYSPASTSAGSAITTTTAASSINYIILESTGTADRYKMKDSGGKYITATAAKSGSFSRADADSYGWNFSGTSGMDAVYANAFSGNYASMRSYDNSSFRSYKGNPSSSGAKFYLATGCSVTYNKNGNDVTGTVPTDAYLYGEGATVTVKSNSGSLAKEGYTFGGWNTKADGTGTTFSAVPTYGTFTINKDTVLYAKWVPDITCEDAPLVDNASAAEERSITSTSIPVQCETGVLLEDGCSVTSYGFCWNTTGNPNIEDDDSHEIGTSLDEATSFDYTISSLSPNTKYYIRAYATTDGGTGYSEEDYEATTLQSYAISYNNNGGSGSMASTTKDHGVDFTLPANAGDMTNTGMHITGWKLNSSSGTHYDLSDSYTTDAAATFYAEWDYNTYEVAFNANGGSGSMSNEDFTYGNSKALTTCSFTAPTHKYFYGWADTKAEADAGTRDYEPGESVSNLTTTNGGTVTLYAVWLDHTFTNYRTKCCTDLSAIGGTVVYSDPSTAVLTWNAMSNVDATTPYVVTYRTGSDEFNDDNVGSITTNGAGKKTCTITGLSCNTDYDFKIEITAASGYCDVDTILEDKNSGKWNVDYTMIGVQVKSGTDEGDNACGDFSVTFEPTSGAYTLPSTISVTIGGDDATVDTDYEWDDYSGELTIASAKVTGAIAVTIVGDEVGCLVDPDVDAASLKTGGTFNLGQVDVTVANSSAGDYCEWTDYGFVWGTSASPALNSDGTAPSGVTKVQVGTSGEATTWDGSLTGSFSTGTTYYYRAYGKNGKDGAAFTYGTGGTFTPRSVTFNSNGGSSVDTKYVNSGTAVTKPSDPTLTGYTFGAWQLNSSNYDFSSAVSSNIELVATWSANNYTVTLDNNSATSGSLQTVSATYDAAMPSKTTADGTPAVAALSRTGYTFTGWWDATSGGKQYYSYNAGTSTLSSANNWDKTSATTLKAQWSANNYTITLDNQSATSAGTESISVTFDANTNLTGSPAITKPTKTNYRFDGYYTAKDGGGSQVIGADGNVIASVASYTDASKNWIQADNVTLYAKWTHVYTVTWSVNGETSTEQVANGEKVAAMPTAPTKADCDDAKQFMGWTNGAYSHATTAPTMCFTTVGGSPTITKDTTFYAVFADVLVGNKSLTSSDIGGFYCNTDACDPKTTTYANSPYTVSSDDGDWTLVGMAVSGGIQISNGTVSISSSDVRHHMESPTYPATITKITILATQGANADKTLYFCSGETADPTSSNLGTLSIAKNNSTPQEMVPSSSVTSFFIYASGATQIQNITVTYSSTSNYATTCASCDGAPTFNATKPTVTEIGCDSAIVTATNGLETLGEGDGCNIREYGFVWGTSSTPTLRTGGYVGKHTVSENIAEDVEFDAEMEDLEIGTQYYVRTYAINKYDTAYSTTQSFYTQGVSSIAVTTAPTKTNYIVGETFDPTGMVVTATMASSDTEDVTADVTYSTSALTAGTGIEFEISYTLCETEKTDDLEINVYTLSVSEGENKDNGAYSTSANIITISSLTTHYTAEFSVTNGSVSSNGDGTYTVIPDGKGNVTVTVNYREAEEKNVTYKVNGVTITSLSDKVYESETATLPDGSELATAMSSQGVKGFEDYPNFVGWIATPFYGQATEPAVLTSNPTITADITYHAVFTNVNKIRFDESVITSGSYPDEEQTLSTGGFTNGFKYYKVCKQTDYLQFQATSSNSYLYNVTSLDNIWKIEVGVSDENAAIPVFKCSASNTVDGSKLTDANTDDYKYIYYFPEFTKYFLIRSDNVKYRVDYIDVFYSIGKLGYVCQTRDYKTEGNWSTAANWSGSAVPTISDVVRIQKPVTVDVTDAKAAAVILDQNSNTGKLTITEGKALVVAQSVRVWDGSSFAATGEEDIVIGSTLAAGTGALVMGDHNGTNKATVNFAVKAKKDGSGHWINQFIGTPFNDETAVLYNYYGTQVYQFCAAHNGTYGGSGSDWTKLTGSDGMTPFMGYNLLRSKTDDHVLWMQGTLNRTDQNQELALVKNGGEVKTENMFANSWMAPIHIDAFSTDDFGGGEATIYIFNAGTPEDQAAAGDGAANATAAGQYIVLPVASAPWTSPTVTVIPAMQAFSVYSTAADQTLTLDYNKLVYTPALTSVGVVPTRAPRRAAREAEAEDESPEVIRLHVQAESGYAANAYVLGGLENFTEGFDNGWDGRFIAGDEEAPQLYIPSQDGNMAISCVPDIEGTVLGFRKGSEDSQYMFSFEYEGEENWYLNDLQKQESTQITDGNTYVFTSGIYDSEARFVISATPIHKISTGVDGVGDGTKARKLLIEDKLYIIRGGRMYSAEGALVK